MIVLMLLLASLWRLFGWRLFACEAKTVELGISFYGCSRQPLAVIWVNENVNKSGAEII